MVSSKLLAAPHECSRSSSLRGMETLLLESNHSNVRQWKVWQPCVSRHAYWQPGWSGRAHTSAQSKVVNPGETGHKEKAFSLSWHPPPPADGKADIQLGQLFCGASSQRLVGKKKKRATAQRAGAKISSQYNSGHFQHCLFAIHFFLCPVERHEENFQAASARATKRDNLCLCGAEHSRREGKKGRQSNAPKCFVWHWSVFSPRL